MKLKSDVFGTAIIENFSENNSCPRWKADIYSDSIVDAAYVANVIGRHPAGLRDQFYRVKFRTLCS